VDGLDLLKEIKSDEALSEIPIVVLSNSSDIRDIKSSY